MSGPLPEKTEIQEMFDAFFQGQKAIYAYFGVERFPTYDYELQQNDETWAADRRTVYHGIEKETDEDSIYSGELDAIYRKNFHTLIFTPSSTGGAGFAYIFDNDKEFKNWTSNE